MTYRNKKMKFKNAKKIATEAFIWCVERFGSPLKNGDVPDFYVYYHRSSDCYGFYDSLEREIVVFPYEIPSKTMLIRTIIHEYTHFLQMPRIKDGSKYTKLEKKFGYEENPMETEAYEAEKKYYKSCYNFLKKRGVI